LADDLVPAIVTVAAVARVDFRNDRRCSRRMGRTSAAAGRKGEGRSLNHTRRRDPGQTVSWPGTVAQGIAEKKGSIHHRDTEDTEQTKAEKSQNE